MHLAQSFTRNVEIGAVQLVGQDGLIVVPTDGGKEVRNSRMDDEPRRWEIALPVVDTAQDTTDYDSVRALWAASERGLHSFDFHCFVDDEDVVVRFDSERSITAPAGHLRHLDTLTIKEVFDDVTVLTVAPAITGTTTVGSNLTVSNGTWTGSPTFTYEWLRDGVEIVGETTNTYTLAAEDEDALISAYVFATLDNETTRAEATAVGPITV